MWRRKSLQKRNTPCSTFSAQLQIQKNQLSLLLTLFSTKSYAIRHRATRLGLSEPFFIVSAMRFSERNEPPLRSCWNLKREIARVQSLKSCSTLKPMDFGEH